MEGIALVVGVVCIFAGGYFYGINEEQDRHVNSAINYHTIVAQQNKLKQINEEQGKLLQMCVEKSK